MMSHRAHIQKSNHNEESMRTFKGFPGGFVAICVVMLSAHVSLFAQPPAGSGNQRMVLIETVIHPSAVAEYEAAMKLRCAAIVKGGGRSCHVYSTAMFGTQYKYYTVVPLDNYAHYDEGTHYSKGATAEERAAIDKKLTAATISSEESTMLLIGSLSIPYEKVPHLLKITEIQVRPGMQQGFYDDVEKIELPAAKKAGMTVFETYKTLMGNSPDRMFTVTGMDKFAELDGGNKLFAAMSKEDMATFEEHTAKYSQKVSYAILEYRKDLSVEKAAK
jgi:hypothetical protein